MDSINTLFEQLVENQVDYSIPVFAGTHNKETEKIKKPVLLKFADDESGVHRDEDAYLEEEKSSTERVRKYYKRHPKKVREYLRKTQDDRVVRNRDRRKAVKKHGKSKMKNHDVHHPNGPGNGWRLAKKDHGPDKKDGTPPEPGPSVTKKPSKPKTTKKKSPSKKPATKKTTPKKSPPKTQPSKKDTLKKSIAAFVLFATKELGITNRPRMFIIPPTPDMTSLGSYEPEENKLVVVVQGRLLADILRTIAHELVHVKQQQDGRITNPEIDGATGSDIENEANALAGVLMRNYAKIDKKIFLSEGLVVEGGAHGHLAHPFEDTDLTFADYDEMLDRALVGNLEKEGPVVEKMDGQNIAFTIRDGRVVFARNKSHLKNRAEKALSAEELAQMFAGRGEVADAFTLAAQDIEAAMKKLNPAEVENIFGDGRRVMSTEIIYPGTKNVIPYDKTVLVFHGTLEHDDDGEKVGVQNTEQGKIVADAVTKANADKQRTFGISGPRTVAISDQTTDEMRSVYTSLTTRLEDVRSTYNLKPTATIADYLDEWWREKLAQIESTQGFKFTNQEKDGLIRRWVENDKKFGVKNLSEDKQSWFREFEKNELKPLLKQSTKPFEQIFLTAGVYSLRRVVEFLSANNPAMAEQLKKEFQQTVQDIRQTGGEDRLQKLELELARLKELGIDNLVPSEGLIFTYNGNPYKLTGAFAPVNQIMGTLKYDRKPAEIKEPASPTKSEEPSKEIPSDEPAPETPRTQEPQTLQKPIAIYPGRFQPYHAGHQVTYDALVQRFGKDNVYIATSNKQDSVTSPFSFNEKREIMSRMFGIPEDHIIETKNPYSPTELVDKLPENTPVIFALGEKDASRLRGTYFQPYKPEERMSGHKHAGYVWIAPPPNLEIDGKEISGTQLRMVMGNPNITDRAKKEIFTKVYGKFDEDIFSKIVKVTEKSEEAKKLTDTHGATEKKKGKKPDEKAISRARDVLRQKVENPKTGREILVATALKYPPTEPVRKAAEKMIQQAMKTNENLLSENKKTSDNLNVYVYVKEYTDDELKHEIEEYFENERTIEAFPDLADSAHELKDMIKKAPVEVLDIEELKALQNSDVSEILGGGNKTQILQQMKNQKKDVVGLLRDIKAKKPISMPVVIKHVSGYYLLGGNTRLSVLASLGMTMPVKVLARSAPLDSPISVYPKKDKNANGKKKGNAKELFKSLLQMRITNPETGNEIKIDTAMDYKKDHPAHKAAMSVIRQRMRGLSNRAGIPKNRKD